jgi:hypothetical protein
MFIRYTHYGIGHPAVLREIARDCADAEVADSLEAQDDGDYGDVESGDQPESDDGGEEDCDSEDPDSEEDDDDESIDDDGSVADLDEGMEYGEEDEYEYEYEQDSLSF